MARSIFVETRYSWPKDSNTSIFSTRIWVDGEAKFKVESGVSRHRDLQLAREVLIAKGVMSKGSPDLERWARDKGIDFYHVRSHTMAKERVELTLEIE